MLNINFIKDIYKDITIGSNNSNNEYLGFSLTPNLNTYISKKNQHIKLNITYI